MSVAVRHNLVICDGNCFAGQRLRLGQRGGPPQPPGRDRLQPTYS